MDLNTLNVVGPCKTGIDQIIYRNTLAAAATTITITGLDGNTDLQYYLACRIVNGYAGSLIYTLTFNSDTATNYGYQFLYGANTTLTASRSTFAGIIIGGADNQNEISNVDGIIYPVSGSERCMILTDNRAANVAATISRYDSSSQAWLDTSNNITQIVITASQTNGFGIGTMINLWARKPVRT